MVMNRKAYRCEDGERVVALRARVLDPRGVQDSRPRRHRMWRRPPQRAQWRRRKRDTQKVDDIACTSKWHRVSWESSKRKHSRATCQVVAKRPPTSHTWTCVPASHCVRGCGTRMARGRTNEIASNHARVKLGEGRVQRVRRRTRDEEDGSGSGKDCTAHFVGVSCCRLVNGCIVLVIPVSAGPPTPATLPQSIAPNV